MHKNGQFVQNSDTSSILNFWRFTHLSWVKLKNLGIILAKNIWIFPCLNISEYINAMQCSISCRFLSCLNNRLQRKLVHLQINQQSYPLVHKLAEKGCGCSRSILKHLFNYVGSMLLLGEIHGSRHKKDILQSGRPQMWKFWPIRIL